MNETLHMGEVLCSEDGNYTAVIQDDGNFVVQGPDKHDITVIMDVVVIYADIM